MSLQSLILQESKRSRELSELVSKGLYSDALLQLKLDGYINSTIDFESFCILHNRGKKKMVSRTLNCRKEASSLVQLCRRITSPELSNWYRRSFGRTVRHPAQTGFEVMNEVMVRCGKRVPALREYSKPASTIAFRVKRIFLLAIMSKGWVRSKVIIIQCFIRLRNARMIRAVRMSRRTTLAALAILQTAAAVAAQAIWRGASCRVKFKGLLSLKRSDSERSSAVLRYSQNVLIGAVKTRRARRFNRQRTMRLVYRALSINRFAAMATETLRTVRHHIRVEKICSVIIQSHIRGFLGRKMRAPVLLTFALRKRVIRRDSVIKLQSIVRGRRCSTIVPALRAEVARARAACNIQNAWNSRRVRRDWTRGKERKYASSILMQRVFRGFMGRQKASKLKLILMLAWETAGLSLPRRCYEELLPRAKYLLA